MEGLLEMQGRKMATMSVYDPKDGAGENVVMGMLQEVVLDLGTLLQKLDRLLPSESGSPQDTYLVLLRLVSVLVVVASLACLIYYVFFRGGEIGAGGWGATKMLKPPRGGWPTTMYEHECIVAAITMLLLVVLSLGGLYYYYCYQASCFGDGMRGDVVMVNATGRKVR